MAKSTGTIRTVSGIILILIGFGSVAGFVPLSGVSSSYATVSVSCDSTGKCILTSTVTNPYGVYPSSNIEVEIGIWQITGGYSPPPSYPVECSVFGAFYCNMYALSIGISQSYTITQDLSKGSIYSPPSQFVPGETYAVEVCGGAQNSADLTNCMIYNIGYTFVYPSSAPPTTTSTSTSTASGTFRIDYPYGAPFQVSPPGSSITICTSNCQGGDASYSAVWPPNTALSLTVGVTPGYQGCWEYNGQYCTTFSSGIPFTVYTQTSNPFVTILFTSTNTSPITITSCVAAPNPCASIGQTGAWSQSSATLSASGTTSTTFTFVPGAGYSCSGDWYLWSTGTNSMVVSGGGAISGVTFTWGQMQAYESTQGTSFQLVSGTLTSAGCTANTSTLSVSWSPAISFVTCTGGTFSGNTCPTSSTIGGGETVTLSAACAPSVCQFTGWKVNGNSAGSGTTLTLSLTTSQNWNVVAYANSVGSTTTSTTQTTTTTGGGGTCTLSPSTNAGITFTVLNSQNSSAVVGATLSTEGVTATTDVNGVATICNIPVPIAPLTNHGTVTVSISKLGYAPTTQSVTVTEGQFTQASASLQPAAKPSIFSGASALGWGMIAAGAVLVSPIGRKKSSG